MTEALVALSSGEEGEGQLMLLGEARFDGDYVGIKSGNGFGFGLSDSAAGGCEEEQQAAEEGEFWGGVDRATIHGLELAVFGVRRQCMESHRVKIDSHGASACADWG